MTRILQCTDCDGRDNEKYVDDEGRCRECQGIERPKRFDDGSYISPDDYERNMEYYDYAAVEWRGRGVGAR